jgi:integrase
MVTIPQDALDALLVTTPPWLKLLILLCHDAALRAGAAIRLCRQNYNQESGNIWSRGKGGKVTTVPVSPRLRAMLDEAPQGDAPFVVLLRGGPVSYQTARSHFMRACARIGLLAPVTLHDLRRTMAQKAYSVTSDLRVVQQLLGHTRLDSTTQYLNQPAPICYASLRELQENYCVIANPTPAPVGAAGGASRRIGNHPGDQRGVAFDGSAAD